MAWRCRWESQRSDVEAIGAIADELDVVGGARQLLPASTDGAANSYACSTDACFHTHAYTHTDTSRTCKTRAYIT